MNESQFPEENNAVNPYAHLSLDELLDQIANTVVNIAITDLAIQSIETYLTRLNQIERNYLWSQRN